MFLLFFLLILSLSPTTPHTTKCPYKTKETEQKETETEKTEQKEKEKEQIGTIHLTKFNFGNFGNRIFCTANAMDTAYRCQKTLSFPKFDLFSSPSSPSSWQFDFRERRGSVLSNENSPNLQDCRPRSHSCKAFFQLSPFRHFAIGKREPFPPLMENEFWSCMSDYLELENIQCPRMEDTLLIHIRNGDTLKYLRHPYPQVQFSALLAPIFSRWWRQVVVISPVQIPRLPQSGPIFDMLYAVKVFFPAPVLFPHAQKYRDHLIYWFCAQHLVLSFTTLNTGLPMISSLKTVFTPGFPCFSNFTTVAEKAPRQYRTASTVFNESSKEFYSPTQENINLLSLTPSPPYELCPESPPLHQIQHSKKKKQVDPPLFEWMKPSNSSLKVHDLVVDLDLNPKQFEQENAPFCALFGAIVSENWNRVIVIDENLNFVGRNILIEGLKMLSNSIPVKLSFVQNNSTIQKIRMNVVNLATFGADLENLRETVRKVYEIGGRGCPQFQHHHESKKVSYYATITREPVEEEEILYEECLTKFKHCTY